MGGAREPLGKNDSAERAQPMRPWEPGARIGRQQPIATAWVARAGCWGSCLRALALHPSYMSAWVAAGRCRALFAHGRMGCARWRLGFLPMGSRATPILHRGMGCCWPVPGTICSWPHGLRALDAGVLAYGLSRYTHPTSRHGLLLGGAGHCLPTAAWVARVGCWGSWLRNLALHPSYSQPDLRKRQYRTEQAVAMTPRVTG